MQDLYDLLNNQISYIHIKQNKYFYDKNKNQFYYKHYKKIEPIKDIKKYNGNTYLWLLLDNNKNIKISKYKLLCYFQNGILPEMNSILDNNYTVIKSNNLFKWISKSEKLIQNNINKLDKVFEDHPELYTKDGFYDEGIISYKYREGFYIVPLTNGTFAINPNTQEAISTYSNKILISQSHEKGDKKFQLNSRLTNSLHTITTSKAIAFITLSIPDRYKYLGTTIKEIINKLDINHIDTNPSNNSINNLQYLTKQENLIKKLNQEYITTVCLSDTWLNPKKMNINRTQLTLFKKEYSVYNIENKKFYLFNKIEDLCNKFNIFIIGLETHIAMKGPLVPYKNLIIFPYRYITLLLNIKYFDNFTNEPTNEKR